MCEDGLYLKAELGGIEVNCLTDTGANRSILHPMKYFSLPLNKWPPLTELSKNILLANGDRIRYQDEALFLWIIRLVVSHKTL